MPIKKLIVREFEVDKYDRKKHRLPQIGEKYTHFQDPDTGKWYRPVDGFTVTGEDLSDRFVEIEAT